MAPLLRLTKRGRIEATQLAATATTSALILDENAAGILLAEGLKTPRRFVAEWPEGSLDAVPRLALSLASQRLAPDALQSLEDHRALLSASSRDVVPPEGVLVLRRAPFAWRSSEELWQPYAGDEAGLDALVHQGRVLPLRNEWVEPAGDDAQAQVDDWWRLADHDPDAFELGAIACRIGANKDALDWRARELLAKQVQAQLGVFDAGLARVFDLLIAHGRAVEERLFAEVIRIALDLPAERLNELVDHGLVRRFGAMVTFLPAGFSCESDPAALRERLADALVRIARAPAQGLRPAAIMEAHRHLASIPARRADARLFARYGAHELVGAARSLSQGARESDDSKQQSESRLEAAKLFDGVEQLARDVGDDELRAYGIHYAAYNRALARAIEPARVRSAYRRSVILWPENGLFWMRSIPTLAANGAGQLDDPSAARAAIDEARAVVAERYFGDYVLRRIAEKLARRKDLLLPLFAGIPEAEAFIARSQDSTDFGLLTRRLWRRGDVRLGFSRGWYFTWRRETTGAEWTTDIVPPGRSEIVCSGRGASLLDAYESMTAAALDLVERHLCASSGGAALDLDAEWMRGGASRSRWLVKLYEHRGVSNEQAPALQRLRDSVLTRLDALGSERPALSYDRADDRVELRWLSPDGRAGLLVASFRRDEACALSWVEDGAPGPVPRLHGPTGQWLKALGCLPTEAQPTVEALLSPPLVEARRAGAAVYRYRETSDEGVKDMLERAVFTREECARGTVYFVDPYPGHGWSHPCRYVLIGADGPEREERRNWPPRSMRDWEAV